MPEKMSLLPATARRNAIMEPAFTQWIKPNRKRGVQGLKTLEKLRNDVRSGG
jgi:hypothetical protein